jgi:holo-[acyl-carrier protein] synthase
VPVVAHGVDLVEVARIESILDAHGDRFPARCFTDGERAYAEAAAGLRAQRYAARFAAKEAVLKALGTGWRNGISWLDIEVSRLPSGRPAIRLRGRCAEIAAEMHISSWHLSLSHTAGSAIASVLGCG